MKAPLSDPDYSRKRKVHRSQRVTENTRYHIAFPSERAPRLRVPNTKARGGGLVPGAGLAVQEIDVSQNVLKRETSSECRKVFYALLKASENLSNTSRNRDVYFYAQKLPCRTPNSCSWSTLCRVKSTNYAGVAFEHCLRILDVRRRVPRKYVLTRFCTS